MTGGAGETRPQEFWVGDANTNIVPPDFVTLHNFKHQNTPFQAKKNHFYEEGTLPRWEWYPPPHTTSDPNQDIWIHSCIPQNPIQIYAYELRPTFAGW